MSYRSLGKSYDWELEKYRMASKPSDTGNKRRFFKNFARFVKHPLGYTYWKGYSFFKGSSTLNLFFGLALVSSLYKSIQEAK
jgi:hypothetical protein